ncbi:MATE family efflux transporter [Anaeromicrobium sediminis]|uniref:Multidrug export protein MepA n=1 Tax=Anaeromicrobium sediminis TaxID=1478221 RepID=A0A267ML17_9FIRM|nr:MATE family efflux transporter [Anaeromicrobium sediminis]PAB60279.1 MATE family efflux transporter [Anaeromicrobium sediminis]
MNERSYMLENEKISKVLMKLSLPATVGMIVNALYNIVDTIFIGRGVGTIAIGALAIAFPIQMIIMAIAQTVGVGGASALSRSLGAKDIERADKVAGNSFISVFIVSIITVVFSFIFMEPILRLFGATENILPYAMEYLKVILLGSLYFPFVVCANNLIRAEGNAKASMIIMVIGTGLNIILDPLFIFVFNMGIAGAAWATIISQFASLVYVGIYMYGGKSALKIRIRHLKLEGSIVKEIFTVGFSSFTRQAAGSVVAIVVNNSLKFYGGDMAISIYGTVNKVIMFLFMPLFGVVQGMQPIVGYNYGAKKVSRVKETVKLSIIVTTILATTSVLIGELFPNLIMKVFTKDKAFIESSASVLRIIIAGIPVIGVQVVGSTLFQSIGKAVPALILSLLRQVLFLIPLVLILPRIGNLGLIGIWMAYPIADILSTAVTGFLLKNEMKKMYSVE